MYFPPAYLGGAYFGAAYFGGAAAGPDPEPGGAYTSPTPAYIRLLTGINEKIENTTLAELDATLAGLIPTAETACAAEVGTALFASASLAAGTGLALQASVAYRVGAIYARAIAFIKGTGTQSPRVMEEAAGLRDQADVWDNDDPDTRPGEAQLYARRALAAPDDGDGDGDGEDGSGFLPPPLFTLAGPAAPSVAGSFRPRRRW